MARSAGGTVAVLAAACICLCQLDTVRACSTMMVPPLASGSTNNVISVRSMDYGGSPTSMDLNCTVNIVPAGSKLWAGLQGADLGLEPLFPPQLFNPPTAGTRRQAEDNSVPGSPTAAASKPCADLLPHCQICKPGHSAVRPATCYQCEPNYDLVDGNCVAPAKKPGMAIWDLPSQDDPRLYFQAKHSFVGTATHIWKSTKPFLDQAMIPNTGIPLGALFHERFGENLFSQVVDGLNDKGLACSIQYDASFSEYPTANVADTSRPNIRSIYTICKYILATFDNADAVVEALNPATTQIVAPQLAGLVRAFFPYHVVVSDRHHQLWVAEFKNYENGNRFAWKNATRWGVMTNEPQFEEQIANLDKYVEEHEDARAMLALVDQMEVTREIPRNTPLAYLQVPGSFSSTDRFVRMALLNRIAPLAYVPHTRFSFMPPVGQVPYAQNEAFMVGLQMADLVNRPIAQGTESAERGVTVTTWRVMRDHTSGIFYFQSFADSVWGHVDIGKDVQGKTPIHEYPGNAFADIETYSLPLNMGKLGYSSAPVGNMF